MSRARDGLDNDCDGQMKVSCLRAAEEFVGISSTMTAMVKSTKVVRSA